jgi:FlaA1/EpsC-like NDP-sugar epimerase
MIQGVAQKIDLFIHNRDARRDLTALWRFPSWKRAVRTAAVWGLDMMAIFVSFMVLIALTRSWAESALLLTITDGATIAVVATSFFFLAGLYKHSWRFVSFADSVSMLITTFVGLAIGWASIAYFSPLAAYAFNFVTFGVLHFSLASMTMQFMRASRRAVRSYRRRQQNVAAHWANDNAAKTALVIGDPEWALSVVDMFGPRKSSAVSIVGVLLPSDDRTISQLANVPVLGSLESFNQVVTFLTEGGRKPDLAIVCDDGINISVRELSTLTKAAKLQNVEILKLSDPASQLLNRQLLRDPSQFALSDLLGRSERTIEHGIIQRQVANQCVLVTGAGGTIGGELVMQLASYRPSRIVLIDHAEFQLYNIEMRLRENHPDLDIAVELCSIRDEDEVRRVFARHLPSVVYHAAALKHVPMVEANPLGGIHTNIIGTRNIANAVTEYSVRAMVQVSTDKAVNPVGMMGATKRVGELYCQSLDLCGVDDPTAPRFMTVRFGNVLGSSGSIVPLFKRQLLEGRPLTVTHPDIERFFMTVGEAVQLILESSARSLEDNTTRGNIFVLDMGEPVKIVDLARRMAKMHGLEPDVDVQIQFVGLRPGEKLYEELFDTCERRVDSHIPNLFEACSRPIPLPLIGKAIDQLEIAVKKGDQEDACRLTHSLVRLPSSDIDISTMFTNDALPARGNHLQLVQGM